MWSRLSNGLFVALALAAVGDSPVASPTVSAQGQRADSVQRVFTYTTIAFNGDAGSRLGLVTQRVVPVLSRDGGTPFALWTPVTMPKGAPFDGLTSQQVVLMAAWPGGHVNTDRLNETLQSLEEVSAVRTDVLESIYLTDDLHIPTGQGFYVHREDFYRPRDVDEVVTLSREAWKTWEPAWNVRVVGLFRTRATSSEATRLLRIAWYRNFEHWTETRQAQKDPESARRFEARSKLELPGSGRAVATDRMFR